MKLKENAQTGTHYNCPVKDCMYKCSSASNFYDHLKHVHNFMEFSDRK